MMICSENSASNALLARLGDGDMLRGAAYVTDFLRRLGLENMYLVAPYRISEQATPAPVTAPTTNVDQSRAQPDYSNQMTVGDMGQLLAGLYQCGVLDSGPFLSFVEPRFTPGECRQMLDVMSINNLGQPLMMSAGVPDGTRVAHKHGYINDTHGNAGIVFTPGGDYALVTALHAPTWLDFQISFPLIMDMSRETYNFLNPDALLETNRDVFIVPVEECQVATNPIIDELTSINYAG
jgi:beta-lactamase class A